MSRKLELEVFSVSDKLPKATIKGATGSRVFMKNSSGQLINGWYDTQEGIEGFYCQCVKLSDIVRWSYIPEEF